MNDGQSHLDPSLLMEINMDTQTRTMDTAELMISPRAARRIVQLIAAEGNEDLMLRVSVSGGGCSGFKYGFSLDDQRNDDDRAIEIDGATVIVDEISLDLLRGAELDFVEEMIGSYFALRNPNASSTCGCGSSFAIG